MINQEIVEGIKTQLKATNMKVNSLTASSAVADPKALQQCEKQLDRLQTILVTYKDEIDFSPNNPSIATHRSQHQQFQLEYNRLKKRIQSVTGPEELFKGSQPSKTPASTNKTDLIQLGHNTQAKAVESLGRALGNVHQMNEKADHIQIELDRQINKLDKIYDDMNDTNTTLKRAEKHMQFFAKQVYTDRIIICLIVLIAIAIIVVMGLAIAGKTPTVSTTVQPPTVTPTTKL